MLCLTVNLSICLQKNRKILFIKYGYVCTRSFKQNRCFSFYCDKLSMTLIQVLAVITVKPDVKKSSMLFCLYMPTIILNSLQSKLRDTYVPNIWIRGLSVALVRPYACPSVSLSDCPPQRHHDTCLGVFIMVINRSSNYFLKLDINSLFASTKLSK